MRWPAFLPTVVAVIALIAATQFVKRQCPGQRASWHFPSFVEKVGCAQHAWWRVQAGNLGILSDVDDR